MQDCLFQHKTMISHQSMHWKKRSNKIVQTGHTETDKMRSTPLSGLLWQTSRMEAAMLMQISLSEVKLVNPLGSKTP